MYKYNVLWYNNDGETFEDQFLSSSQYMDCVLSDVLEDMQEQLGMTISNIHIVSITEV